jgi:hypothetical protein
MDDLDAYRLAQAIEEAGTYIGIGLVLASIFVTIGLFRVAKALREHGQRLP